MLQEIAEACWRIDTGSGPKVAILGGVHGNELTGIRVVERLRDELLRNHGSISHGTLFLILGNPRAIAQHVRYLEHGKDLNRSFHPDILDTPSDGSHEEERARILARILRAVDVSIDLHSTNKPSVPFLACATGPRHEHIYRWFHSDRILADPGYILGGSPVTTDEFVDAHGGIGVCFETGWSQDTSRTEQVYQDVCSILRDLHMINDGAPNQLPSDEKHIYQLTCSTILRDHTFAFAPGMGAHSFQEVERGALIGCDVQQRYVAPEQGVIVFPKIREHWKIGSPVYYFAKQIS